MAGWAVPVAALLSSVLADTTAPVLLGSTSQLPKQWKSDGIVLDTRTITTCSVSNIPPKLVPVGAVNIYLDRTPRENQCPTMWWVLFQGNLGWWNIIIWPMVILYLCEEYCHNMPLQHKTRHRRPMLP